MIKIKNLVTQTTGKISRANVDIAKLGSVQLLNVILALVISILTVQIFGITREIEIYFAAIISMQTIDRLFSLGTINDILLPEYIRLKEESRAVAMEYFSLITNWFFLVSCGFSVIIWFSAPLFLQTLLPGFNAIEVAQTVSIFCVLALFIPVKIFNGMCSIPFRADRIYTVHERTGIVSKLILIAMLLIFRDNYGILVLVAGTVIGIIIRLLYVLYLLNKHHYQYRFIVKNSSFSVRWIFSKLYIPFLQTIGLQINRWIMLAAFTLLSPGLLAIYQYVLQIYNNYYSIVTRSLGTIFLTEVSDKENRYNSNTMLSYLTKGSLISFFSFTVAVCVGKEILQLIWQSSKFGYDDILLAYYLLTFFFFTMFLSTTQNLYLRSSIARGNITRQFLGDLVLLLISSIILYLTSEELGLLAILISGLFRAISQSLYAAYINYVDNREHFVIYEGMHVVKALLQSFLVILLILAVFNYAGLGGEMSKVFAFIAMCVKGLLAVGVFLIINRYLKVYNIGRVLSQ